MLVIAALIAAAPVSAQEAADKAPVASPAPKKAKTATPVRYAPDYCDFEVTFPETPMKQQRCTPGGGQCYELNSYTMVYDLQTTVDVSVTCNPSTPKNYERYTEQVMKAALTGMIGERNLDNHEIGFSQMDDVRSASLTGTGKTGRQEKIYTSQLWIGQNSVFTVQAELVGASHPEGDVVFSTILQSIKVKEKPAAKAEDAEDDKDTGKDED